MPTATGSTVSDGLIAHQQQMLDAIQKNTSGTITEDRRHEMSRITMMDVTVYHPLHQAYEMAVRQSELYQAMLIVEQCGASPELTEAINRLGTRMKHIREDLQNVCKEITAGE